MNTCPTSQCRIQSTNALALTSAERRIMGGRIIRVLVGAGLLLLGYLHGLLFGDQAAVGGVPLVVAAILVGTPVVAAAIKGFLATEPHSFTEQLVALAIIAALSQGDFVVAALVPLLMDFSHILEERSILGAQAAIEGLKTLYARKAVALENGVEREVSPEELTDRSVVVVRPGEVIPADGVVIKGATQIDQSSITGEPEPEDAGPGARLFAGSLNLTGLIRMQVTGVGADTAIGRVLELMKQAEGSKAPINKLLEKYSVHYLPLVALIAASTLFFTRELSRAITIFVVSCPCAFVLSSPTAMIAALAVAARFKILIKNTRFLEAASEVDTLIFDKTGTVTLGRMDVAGIEPAEGVAEDELLALTAQCSAGSRHPVSRALTEYARARGLECSFASSLTEIPGKGIEVQDSDGVIRIGRREWMAELGVLPESGHGDDEQRGSVYISRGNKLYGKALLNDQPRPETAAALAETRRLGIERTVLLTGDREQAARKIAEEFGFDRLVFEALPEHKLEVVQQEKDQGRRTMFVGDGINDALALKAADVGVALGAMGSDVALNSADVAFMSNDLGRVPMLIKLSRRTRSIINQNVIFGAGFSVLMLVLASAGIINPITGVLLHNGGALFVLLNSGRLLKFDG